MAALVAVLLAVLVLLALPILPAVLADAHPRRFRDRWTPASLGRGLDRGFGLARVAGEVLFVALTLGTTLGLLAPTWPERFPSFFSDSGSAVGGTWVRTWMSWLGGTAAISFATVLALSGRVSLVSQRISPVLDVLLDVDNHLRVEPSGFEGRNARAQIVARAVALLGELRRGGYQRVVFVAHSQGTALVADLFRQLRFRGERVATDVGAEHLRELGPKLQFLTMGSPLRQLYHLRFPHLYGWVQGATAADLGIRALAELLSRRRLHRTRPLVFPSGRGPLFGRDRTAPDGHNNRREAPEPVRRLERRREAPGAVRRLETARSARSRQATLMPASVRAATSATGTKPRPKSRRRSTTR